MTAPIAKFSKLLALAKEHSSEKRRELLHEITDIFVTDPGQGSQSSYAALDELAVTILSGVTAEVRSDLARTFMESTLPLGQTAAFLANNEIEIASPVIERWAALTERDLLGVIATRSQDHLMAVSRRPGIGEPVSDALVSRGEDRVVASLLANRSARIGRHTYEKMRDRARASATLHAPMVRREGVPLDIMAALYSSLSAALRKEILSRYADVSPEALDEIMEKSWTRVEKMLSALPKNFEKAARQVRRWEDAGELNTGLLDRLAKEGPPSRLQFMLVFAKLTGESYDLVARVFEARDADAIALLCRAAGFSLTLYTTVLRYMEKDATRAMVDACCAIYDMVPVAAAQRAVRFWKLRTNLLQARPHEAA